MNGSVSYSDTKTLRNRLEEIVGEMTEICDVFEFSRRKSELKELLAKIREQKLTAVVAGEFNRGKSMFVNSLLGEDFLPTGITPTKSLVSVLKYGPVKALKAVYADGYVRTILPEELEDLRSDESKDIVRVDIEMPNEILKWITLVDTPGVNDPDEIKLEILYGHINSADVLIYVMSCDQAFTWTERLFLSRKLLKSDLGKTLFVLNKSDIVRKRSDLEILEKRAEKYMAELVEFPQFVIYSALRALNGHLENNDEMFEKSNFKRLREILDSEFIEKKDKVLLSSVHGKLSRIASFMSRRIEQEEKGARSSIERLETEIAELGKEKETARAGLDELKKKYTREFQKIRDGFRLDIREFGFKFVEMIPEQLDGVEVEDIERYLPFFIQDTFKQFIEDKTGEVHARLAHTVHGVYDDLQREMSGLSFSADFFASRDNPGGLTLMDKMLIGIDFLGLGSLFATPPTGKLILLSGGVLGGSLKGRIEKKVLPEIVEKSRNAISESSKAVEDMIIEVFGDIEKSLLERIESFFEKTFEDKEKSLAGIIEKKQSGELKGGGVDTRICRERLGQILDELGGMKENIGLLSFGKIGEGQ